MYKIIKKFSDDDSNNQGGANLHTCDVYTPPFKPPFPDRMPLPPAPPPVRPPYPLRMIVHDASGEAF